MLLQQRGGTLLSLHSFSQPQLPAAASLQPRLSVHSRLPCPSSSSSSRGGLRAHRLPCVVRSQHDLHGQARISSTPPSEGQPAAAAPQQARDGGNLAAILTRGAPSFLRGLLGATALLTVASGSLFSAPAHAARPRASTAEATATEMPSTSTAEQQQQQQQQPAQQRRGSKQGQPISKRQEALDALAAKGVPLDYEDLMRSMVYDPDDVPTRLSKVEIQQQLEAILNQYEMEDFDLGIKQFMIEQAIQQDMEDGGGKGSDNKDFEQKLGEALFADDMMESREAVREEDVPDDAFTTEVVEEYLNVLGEPSALKTAWRTTQSLKEMTYTQFWALVGEGNVERVRYFGPEKRAVMVKTKESAPGGARFCKVVIAPDPSLFDHLVSHGVKVDLGETEQQRLGRAFTAQLLRYTFPFMFISAVFWVLHTWLLDPMPNGFKRQEFLRYRREMMHVASKLNFRSPAREVRIDQTAPDFIPWDEIHGIDEVKLEITEIIDYLKNPALLRQRGVARIGGVMLAGAPGTGKTLLAKSIAAESGVRMFTCSGTDFYDMYSGVGARRIRETFEKLRSNAPAILFVDEFDALGAARGAQSSGDESAAIINELLVQMDGFEDNRGIVLLGATNRPAAIDSALIRPGRFDRIIYMPLPDAVGRAKIMQVHARNKSVDPTINWYEVARAMAGFTGADCMGLMQRGARMAARQGRDAIIEEDMYAAMENKALEAYSELTGMPKIGDSDVPTPLPESLRKAIACYEAGKAMMAYMTPEFEEVVRVSVCPFDLLTGYTLFVEDEDRSVNALLTRADMEAHMVVSLAGRSAEKLVMGEGEMTAMGAPDLFHANMIAREMVMTMGMGRRMGPIELMKLVQNQQGGGLLLRTSDAAAPEEDMYYTSSDMSTEQARVAMADVVELLEAAEAKAYYGLAINWKPLQALTQALLDRGVLQGREVAHILETSGIIHFPDPFTTGFGWDPRGDLIYPNKPASPQSPAQQPQEQEQRQPEMAGVKGKTWFAGTEYDAPRDEAGNLYGGWHWNMPYSIKRDLPDWYSKELQRYVGKQS